MSLSLLLLSFDPDAQFPGKKNYAIQRKNRKTSEMVFTPAPSQNYQEIE